MVAIEETSFCIKFTHTKTEQELRTQLDSFLTLMGQYDSKIHSFELRGVL